MVALQRVAAARPRALARPARLPLEGGGGGVHVLISDVEVGLRVMGYGVANSYHYPGGLNLKGIAPPLPPAK